MSEHVPITGKTVKGCLVVGLSLALRVITAETDWLGPLQVYTPLVSGLLEAAGGTLAGVGLAHKLDKARAVLQGLDRALADVAVRANAQRVKAGGPKP